MTGDLIAFDVMPISYPRRDAGGAPSL